MARSPETTESQPRWEQRSAERVVDSARDRLLARSRRFVEKATEVVARDGVDGLTLRAVLSETGLSRRAFYERFESKDDLLVAVFEETLRSAAETYRRQMDAKGLEAPLDRLRFLVEEMITVATREAADSDGGLPTAMSREHLRLAESRPDELRQALAPTTDLMAELIGDAMKSGAVRSGDSHELAVMVHTLVSSMIHSALFGGSSRPDAAHTAEAVWDFCRRALVA